MTISVEAIYENGLLRLSQPLPLQEREKVQVTVRKTTNISDHTYGLIGWSGDADTFDRILKESESDLQEHL
jgi:predicted DNA-binding antitoxin AbrB/MazE fold protein